MPAGLTLQWKNRDFRSDIEKNAKQMGQIFCQNLTAVFRKHQQSRGDSPIASRRVVYKLSDLWNSFQSLLEQMPIQTENWTVPFCRALANQMCQELVETGRAFSYGYHPEKGQTAEEMLLCW